MSHPLLWFHAGTAPAMAIYPDDVGGTNPLKALRRKPGLAPVNWVHRGTRAMKALYPDDCSTLTARDLSGHEQPVYWFHRGTGPLTAVFPDEVGGEEEESYTGPLDLVPGALMAYGQRALSAAMLEQPLYTLRNGAGSSQSFSSDSSGDAPTASIVTFVGTDKGVFTVAIAAGGTGYDNGADASQFTVTLVGGTSTVAATVQVQTNGSGVVTKIDGVNVVGHYSAPPTNPVATTGDDGTNHGTGLTFTCTFHELGFISTWSDQSGNANDLTQAVALSQPWWDSAGANSKPCLPAGTKVLGARKLTAGATVDVDGAWTSFHVLRQDANGTTQIVDAASGEATSAAISLSAVSGALLDFYAYSDDGVHESGVETEGACVTEDEFLLVEVYATGATIEIYVNGASESVGANFGADGIFGACSDLDLFLEFVNNANGRAPMTRVEDIIYASALSSGDRLALRQNIAAYYGITLA